MPEGDAEKFRRYLCQMVEGARSLGIIGVGIRAGNVRDAMVLEYSDAITDICQVLETQKFQREAQVTFLNKTGPSQGVDTVYWFTLL